MSWENILFGYTKLASVTCILPQEAAWMWACYQLASSPFSHQPDSRDLVLQPWHISWKRPHIWMANFKTWKRLISLPARGKSAPQLPAQPIYPYISDLGVEWWLKTSEQKAEQPLGKCRQYHYHGGCIVISSCTFVRCGAIRRWVV